MAKVALEQESVVDKIRAEIEEHCGLAKENHCRYCSYCNNLMGIREILEIIDKYKGESKEEE
jgi:predicted aldo/keto reductase-like oxidoreductase